MRRRLLRATLTSIAVAAVTLFARPTQPPDGLAFRLEIGQISVRHVSKDELPLFLPNDQLLHILPERTLRPSDVNLRRLLSEVPASPEIDHQISAMDCRIVAKERLGGDRFLLTEECRWKGGRVEQRRFTALRKGDGPSQGWMYKLAESDI
jgi:hypothetical protein